LLRHFNYDTNLLLNSLVLAVLARLGIDPDKVGCYVTLFIKQIHG